LAGRAQKAAIEAVALNNDGGDRRSDQFDKNKNIKLNQGGTSASYRAAKLKRDYPDVAERLVAGEFKSVAEDKLGMLFKRPAANRGDFAGVGESKTWWCRWR
jgi:hypothetical protein